jgi:tRNA(Ile)-lysidine synthase
VEEAARQARYSFLQRAREDAGAGRIALGHTADDQVETVLMNFFRGAGLRGLRAMLPVRDGVFIRPLLENRREETEDYCRSEGLEPAFDESNRDLRFTRNFLRHRLVPLLDERFGGWKDAVLRSGRLAAEETEALADYIAALEKKCLLTWEGECLTVSKAGLDELAPAVRGLVLQDCLAQVAGSREDLHEATVREVWALATAKTGYGRREVKKGLWAEKEYDRLRFSRSAPSAAHDVPWREVALSVPGRAFVPELGLALQATQSSSGCEGESRAKAANSRVQRFDLQCLGHSLTVRPWLPGDKLRPLGLGGSKKLQDLFVDKKIPVKKRSTIPVVTDSKGRIAWVVGHTVDEAFKVRHDTKEVAVLTAVWPAEEAPA